MTYAESTPSPSPLLVRASAVLAAGGLAWLAKMAVIAATDGAEDGAADTITSIFYLSGVLLMAAGLAGIAVALTAGRPLVVRIVAGVVGFISWAVIYALIESIAKAIAGDAGPEWFPEEVGILATGAVLMTVGLLLLRPRRAVA